MPFSQRHTIRITHKSQKHLQIDRQLFSIHLTLILWNFDLDLQTALTFLLNFSGIQAYRNNREVKVCQLFIWPWPWPNEIDTQTWPRYGQSWCICILKIKFLALAVQVVGWTDRHTDRQTDPTEIITYPHMWMVITQCLLIVCVYPYLLTTALRLLLKVLQPKSYWGTKVLDDQMSNQHWELQLTVSHQKSQTILWCCLTPIL